jgi:glycosyltransferase involved in cell wall biosynthesis
MNTSPSVSIVVPTRNSEKTLIKCLESIRDQTWKNIELIIADELSNDRTVAIAREFTDRVYVSAARERSAQKNLGIAKASGKYICFIDSDMMLTPTIIEECLRCINSDERIGGVIIPERSVGDSFWVAVRDFERSFYVGSVIESARFFRSDLVQRAGGFDEAVVFFEESVLPQKIAELGYSVTARIKSEIKHLEQNFSLLQHLRKQYYYGKTTRTYHREHNEYFKRQYSVSYRVKLFVANVRFLRRPLFGFFVLILKMFELGCNKLGAFSARVTEDERPR